MSEHLPQLAMRLNDLSKIPELHLPENFTLHTENENSQKSWERIIGDSFKGAFRYTMMTEDLGYAPDRVFFIQEHRQDIATAAAFYHPERHDGDPWIHMVGTHSWATGMNSGYYAVLAALHRHKADGHTYAVLTTDDFRLPAIVTYLRLGFEPVMSHESHEGRWKAIMEKLAEYKKADNRPIPLWPQGQAPYIAESQGQAEPSLKPFPAAGSKGAVIVCPGGAYLFKSWFEGDPISRMIRAAGVSAYTLDYRVKPAPLEAPMADARRAVRLLRSMGYEKVGILGFSAGGHLSAMTAVHWDEGCPDSPDPVERFSSRPDAFIPCYGAIHTPRWAGADSDRYDAPANINDRTPPAFIWHSANDGMVPVSHALDLTAALTARQIPVELHIFPDALHGLGLAFGTSAEGWGELLQKWLLSQGFGRE